MDDDVETVSVPREVLWLCLVAPLLFLPLMTPRVYSLPWQLIFRRLLGAYAPFLLTPLLVKFTFDGLAPRWLRGVGPSWLRFARYGILASAASLVASLLTLPLCQYLVGPVSTLTMAQHLVNGLVITWIIALPSVAFELQRKRALRSERQTRAERQVTLEAQLAVLSARMQPHFFFNSVNTVASLIPEDPERAEQTLIRLADILRYALEGGSTRFVSLQRELQVVRDYLEVQQARFESKLRWSIDAAPELAGLAVPRLFLQPLVENAVLHGVAQRSTGGEVRVRARLEASSAWIEVTDDGVGPGASQHHGSGTALVDLAARLQLLYGDEGRLESEAHAGGGFRVRVTVPAQDVASCE